MTNHGWRSKSQPLSIGLLLAVSIAGTTLLSSCIVVPLGTDTENIDLEQHLTITMGKTSREEMVAALGEPSIIWETERVLVYTEGVSQRLLWIVPYGGVFGHEVGEDIIIMRFDKSGRIERLEQHTYAFVDGAYLRRWITENEQEQERSDGTNCCK